MSRGLGAAFELFALIVQLAAPGEGNFHFDLALLEVDFCGNHGETLLLDASGEQMNFAVMKQELFCRGRDPAAVVAAAIVGSNAHAHDKGFALAALDETVAEADLPGPDAFYLRPGKNDARFKKFKKFVVLTGFAVVDARRVGHGDAPEGKIGKRRPQEKGRAGREAGFSKDFTGGKYHTSLFPARWTKNAARRPCGEERPSGGAAGRIVEKEIVRHAAAQAMGKTRESVRIA